MQNVVKSENHFRFLEGYCVLFFFLIPLIWYDLNVWSLCESLYMQIEFDRLLLKSPLPCRETPFAAVAAHLPDFLPLSR